MLRSRESFDIDNASLRAREANLSTRLQEHVVASEARFQSEAEDRYNSSTALREQLGAWVSPCHHLTMSMSRGLDGVSAVLVLITDCSAR